MSQFKELIKSFPKTREYVRDFFVYGFKTRDEFKEKSARTYDNERRRIESWLSGFVVQDYTEQGKQISLAIDSNLLDTNPLYRVWKTKSFTDNDILLHFFLLDYLTPDSGKSVEDITDGILDAYGTCFDVQTVRRKCIAYEKEGLLTKEKAGKAILYRKSPDLFDCIKKWPGSSASAKETTRLNMKTRLADALSFYQLSSPLGIVGDTILDNMGTANILFRIKHSFFVHTLEDEMLSALLKLMHGHRKVRLQLKGTKNSRTYIQTGVPLQIFTSTRTGRRYLCLYLEKKRRFSCFRLDSIKKTEGLEPAENYAELRDSLLRNQHLLWGVSFANDGHTHTQHIRLTLHIMERTEGFLLNRLAREGRGGTVTKIAPCTYTYEKEVFDAYEMLPWIRTFTGRIICLESDNAHLVRRFYNDLDALYEMYGIKEKNAEEKP